MYPTLFDCVAMPGMVHDGTGFRCPLGQEVVGADLLEMLREQSVLLGLRLRESI